MRNAGPPQHACRRQCAAKIAHAQGGWAACAKSQELPRTGFGEGKRGRSAAVSTWGCTLWFLSGQQLGHRWQLFAPGRTTCGPLGCSAVAHRVINGLGKVGRLGAGEPRQRDAAVLSHEHLPLVGHVLHLQRQEDSPPTQPSTPRMVTPISLPHDAEMRGGLCCLSRLCQPRGPG